MPVPSKPSELPVRPSHNRANLPGAFADLEIDPEGGRIAVGDFANDRLLVFSFESSTVIDLSSTDIDDYVVDVNLNTLGMRVQDDEATFYRWPNHGEWSLCNPTGLVADREIRLYYNRVNEPNDPKVELKVADFSGTTMGSPAAIDGLFSEDRGPNDLPYCRWLINAFYHPRDTTPRLLYNRCEEGLDYMDEGEVFYCELDRQSGLYREKKVPNFHIMPDANVISSPIRPIQNRPAVLMIYYFSPVGPAIRKTRWSLAVQQVDVLTGSEPEPQLLGSSHSVANEIISGVGVVEIDNGRYLAYIVIRDVRQADPAQAEWLEAYEITVNANGVLTETKPAPQNPFRPPVSKTARHMVDDEPYRNPEGNPCIVVLRSDTPVEADQKEALREVWVLSNPMSAGIPRWSRLTGGGARRTDAEPVTVGDYSVVYYLKGPHHAASLWRALAFEP